MKHWIETVILRLCLTIVLIIASTCDNLFSVRREGAMTTREAIDYDLEFLYKSARSIHKLPSDSQEDIYLARVRELVIDRKLTDQAARSKAFNEVML